jgi:16S rRNA (guanine527-N7)-methyltransferase
MTAQLEDQLRRGCSEINLSLDQKTLNSFLYFIELLLKWNKAYNLTAISDPEEVVSHHILDSLSIVPYIVGNLIMDLGSGAGFPGIPCALMLPEKQFVLLDGNGKKTRFMTQAVGELGLSNVRVVQSRVEDYRPDKCFDTITVRAFSSVATIIKQTSRLICPSGEVLIMKGIYPEAELQTVTAGMKVVRLEVPGLNSERHLVCIKGLSNE